jgi:hypothetical protein
MPNNPHKYFGDPQSMAINTYWLRGNKDVDLGGATPGAIYIVKNASCDLVLLDAYLCNNGAVGTNSQGTTSVKLGTDLDDDAFSTTCTVVANHPVNDHAEITLGTTIASRTLPAGRDLILTLSQLANAGANTGVVVLLGFPTQDPT